MLRAMLAAIGLALVATASLQAADHLNLQPDLPVTIEDAVPLPHGERELQALIGYERTDGDDVHTLEPRLQIGFMRNLQLGLGVPYRFSDSETADSGEMAFEALYGLNPEGTFLPALALAGELALPFGDKDRHVESKAKAIGTKSLGRLVPGQLHLNLSWRHAFDPDGDEREERYSAAIGYSRPLAPDTLLVTDLVREQALREQQEETRAEAGIRYRFTPLAILSAGGGVGLDDRTPDLQLRLGLQFSFNQP